MPLVIAGVSRRSRRFLRDAVIVLSLTAILTTLVAIFGSFQFGSLRAAMAYVRGEHLYCDRPVIDLGHVRIGGRYRLTYTVTNLSGRAIKVLETRVKCTCTSIEEFPEVFLPRRPRLIQVDFTPTEADANQTKEQEVEFFVDDPSWPRSILVYRASVEPWSWRVNVAQCDLICDPG